MPVMDFLGRSIKIAIITSVALAGGLYQSHIAEVIVKTPDALASALISGGTQGEGAAFLIDQSAEKGLNVVADACEKAGFFSENGIIYAVFAAIILLATGVLVAIGGAFILISKIALALLAGLGPIFIVALLFQSTQRFFDMWAAQIFNYALLIVIFSAVFGFMMNIFASYMGDVALDGVANVSYTLGGAVIISIIMMIVLLQLPSIATGLAGGISTGFLHEQRALRGMVGGAVGQRQKRDADGRMTQRGSGVVGVVQALGSGVGKAYGYFRGRSGKGK